MRVKMQILELDGTLIEEVEGEMPDDIAELYLGDFLKRHHAELDQPNN